MLKNKTKDQVPILIWKLRKTLFYLFSLQSLESFPPLSAVEVQAPKSHLGRWPRANLRSPPHLSGNLAVTVLVTLPRATWQMLCKERREGVRKCTKMLKLLLHWVLLLKMSQEKALREQNTLRTSQSTKVLFTRGRERERSRGHILFFFLRETKISDVGKTRFRVVLSNILEACRKDWK